MKSSVNSLANGLKEIGRVAGSTFSFSAPLINVISTVAAKLEEANNRRQFVEAMRLGQPIIRNILFVFSKDAIVLRKLREKMSDRKWTKHQDTVADILKRMRALSMAYKRPDVNSRNPIEINLANRLGTLETSNRAFLNQAELTTLPHILPSAGTKIIDEIVIGKLERSALQAKEAAGKYEATLDERDAFRKVIVSYFELLKKTVRVLAAVRVALDSPPNIRQQANELLSFVFAVKRDFESLRTARRAASAS